MRRYKKDNKVKLGIYGLGSTHFSISLCNYLASVEKARVAYVEVGNGVCEEMTNEIIYKNGLGYFNKMKVDYFPSLESEEISRVYFMDYNYIVIDFNNDFEKSHDDLMIYKNCDRRICLTSLSNYRRRKYYKQRIIFNNDMIDVEFLSHLLTKKEIVWNLRTYKELISRAPVIYDPFSLSGSDLIFFRKFMAVG